LSPTPGTTSDEYKASLRRLIKYLEGGRKTITRELEKEMQQAAKNQEFEAAARLRNRLRDLAELQRRIMFGDSEFMNISKDMALARLADILQLPKIPARIEAYDISHMSGAQVVASMVVFSNGVSNRSEYRKFKLAEKNDDTGNMRETMIRRLKHLKDWGKPDLVVIDGGLPQLGAVADLLRAENIAYVGRNKSGNHSHSVGVQLMVPGGDVYETLALDSGDHVARLIARLDEEAHRFAVSYHTTLKRQKQTASDLEEIPGIGPATRRKLIRAFGSLRAVKNATYAQLVEVLGESRAAKLKPYL
jgi:excinuclease ABC subunit C